MRWNNSIDPIINSEFASKISLSDRINVLNAGRTSPPRTVREDQWRILTSGVFPNVLEVSDRCASAFAVDARHPFMDTRLIEFCLALPSEQKLFQGWSRIVMRRAMEGTLPEKIRWRGGKTDMNPNFLRGLLILDRRTVEQAVLEHSQVTEKYIDIGCLLQLYRTLTASNLANIKHAMALWKAVTLAYWLRNEGSWDCGTTSKRATPVNSRCWAALRNTAEHA
jgi:asparagine synthase (glutamine-hydrolysing)